MATFGDLKSEVNTLLIDNPTAVQQLVGTWVNRAVRKLMQKHNFKDMEESVSFTTTSLTRLLGARPTNWKQPRGKPYVEGPYGDTTDIKLVSSEAEAKAAWGTSTTYDYGSPQGIVEDSLSGTFQVFPFPDGLESNATGQYTVTVPYWKFLNPLLADTDFNWLTINGEQWIVYQSVAEGFYANEDEKRAQVWETRAAREYADIVRQDKMRYYAHTQELIPHLGALRPHV